jgi:hypothetical protein
MSLAVSTRLALLRVAINIVCHLVDGAPQSHSYLLQEHYNILKENLIVVRDENEWQIFLILLLRPGASQHL